MEQICDCCKRCEKHCLCDDSCRECFSYLDEICIDCVGINIERRKVKDVTTN